MYKLKSENLRSKDENPCKTVPKPNKTVPKPYQNHAKVIKTGNHPKTKPQYCQCRGPSCTNTYQTVAKTIRQRSQIMANHAGISEHHVQNITELRTTKVPQPKKILFKPCPNLANSRNINAKSTGTNRSNSIEHVRT